MSMPSASLLTSFVCFAALIVAVLHTESLLLEEEYPVWHNMVVAMAKMADADAVAGSLSNNYLILHLTAFS